MPARSSQWATSHILASREITMITSSTINFFAFSVTCLTPFRLVLTVVLIVNCNTTRKKTQHYLFLSIISFAWFHVLALGFSLQAALTKSAAALVSNTILAKSLGIFLAAMIKS